MLDLARQLRINESVVCSELDDEMVLLNIETGIYFGLDAVGTAIWRLLVKGADESEIVRRLLAEYDVEPVRLRTDVSAFLNLLSARGLLHPERG